MRKEVPEFKRCCFCLPLRRGLLAWGYTKVVIHFLAMLHVASVIYFLGFRHWAYIDAKKIAILACMIIFLLVDMSFNVVFIVAGHKKNEKLLKISFVYNIVWLSFLLLGNCFVLYINFGIAFRLWSYVEYRKYILLDMVCSTGFTFGLIFVQIYLILLIRSEMMKLRNQRVEIQFTNHAASGEPQCTVHNLSDAGQCTDEKLAAQNVCTDQQTA